MHAGKSYKLTEFVVWTRRNTYKALAISIVPVVLFQVFGMKWIAMPWAIVAMVGTAAAFIVGFRNSQTYNRTWEARQIWGSILNLSRSWGTMARDFINNPDASRKLYYRHFAWLTALRYAMRDSRTWETVNLDHNKEYQQFYDIPERATTLEEELGKYLEPGELTYILGTKNKAAQLLSLQSKATRELFDNKLIDEYRFVEMQRGIKDLFDAQGRSERIKNFPYPRQFSTISKFLVWLFCIMLPFSLLKEFDKLNDGVTGFLHGHMVWLAVPFSVLIAWVFTSLDQVGESTENPFEGSANDVPISQISRTIEIDMREMLGETDLPPALVPKNSIIL